MKIAIVGTSHALTENEHRDVEQFVAMILEDYSKSNLIISGGAKGVDTIAVDVAQRMGYPTQIYHPESEDWDGFSKRNLEIAEECDELFCISIPIHDTPCYHHNSKEEYLIEHQKTAGCWTMNKALELDKPCRLLVTPKR